MNAQERVIWKGGKAESPMLKQGMFMTIRTQEATELGKEMN